MSAVATLYDVPNFRHPDPQNIGVSGGVAAGLHGSGEPGALLGDAGSTYVNDDDGSLWWKSTDGWRPE